MAGNDLTSQLTLASLLGGGQQGLTDPTLAAALPRLQMAQTMMQQGTDSSPANKWQGISRLANALVGNYAFDKATTGLQDAYAGAAQGMSDALPKGSNGQPHPLTAALMSSNPMVRAAAMKVFPAAITQLSSVDQARPGAVPTIGTTPFGAPNAPLSEPGKLAYDAGQNPLMGSVAGNIEADLARGKASGALPAEMTLEQYKAAQEAWVANNKPLPNTAPGTDTIGRGSPQPLPPGIVNIPGQGNIPTPRFDAVTGQPLSFSATPPAMPAGAHPGGPGPLAGGPGTVPPLSPQDAATVAAAPHVGSMPPKPAATMPPQVTTVPQTSATSAFPPEPVMSENAKTFEGLGKSATESRGEIAQALLLQKDLNALGSTGPATPYLANLSRYAAQAGVPENVISALRLPNGATEAQAAANANMLAMEVAKAKFPGRVTNVDIKLAQSTKPSTEMPLPASNFLINNSIIPNAQWNIDRYNHVSNMGAQGDPSYSPGYAALPSRLNEFDNSHPVTSYMPHLQNSPAAAAAAALRAHPSQAADYDARYGAGSAAQILGPR